MVYEDGFVLNWEKDYFVTKIIEGRVNLIVIFIVNETGREPIPKVKIVYVVVVMIKVKDFVNVKINHKVNNEVEVIFGNSVAHSDLDLVSLYFIGYVVIVIIVVLSLVKVNDWLFIFINFVTIIVNLVL